MTQTKIEWVARKDCKQGYTWNPVYGCRNGCEYCYARRIAKRFPDRFGDFNVPHWVEENYRSLQRLPEIPSMIFVNSMSDLKYWEKTWFSQVLHMIRAYPEHRYFFLTKHPHVYEGIPYPDNCWLGATVTNTHELKKAEGIFSVLPGKKYLSIEPIHESVSVSSICRFVSWIIVGAETGNRKGKIVPQSSWIKKILIQAEDENTQVFLKNSLAGSSNPDSPFLLHAYPWTDIWERKHGKP